MLENCDVADNQLVETESNIKREASFSSATLAVRRIFSSLHQTMRNSALDLFDFFFPEQAQASHLRSIARNTGLSKRRSAKVSGQTSDLTELRQDVRFLTLVLAAIIKRLSETETMNLADVQDLLDEIDTLDGVADGSLEPGVLRGILGVLKQDTGGGPAAGNEEFEIVPTPRYRNRG